jgi:FAD/FMN-containing dehydrogenase
MGMTGFVGTVSLQMRRVETSWMRVRHTPARGLDELAGLLSDPEHDDAYTVAWIDCAAKGGSLGRGVLMAGHHAGPDEVPGGRRALEWAPKRARPVPFDLPSSFLNPLTVRAFNALYGWAQGRRGAFVCPIEPFFYPLDALAGCNRLYGRRGFVQYQFAVPTANAVETTRTALRELSAAGLGSPLGVLKRLGPQGDGMLSFPLEGLTLALDVPVRPGLWDVLDRLDEAVADAGGRVYLAKDARLSRAMFERMYPRAGEFMALKQAVDPQGRIASDLGRRLGLCP